MRRTAVLAFLGVGVAACIAGGALQRVPGDLAGMTRERTVLYLLWAAGAGAFYAAAVLLPGGARRGRGVRFVHERI